VAADGNSLSGADQDVRWEASMFENLHWTVQAIPIVVIGGVLLTWLLGRHKEKKSSDHIFKI
jgi:hypothetical protein